MDKRDAYIHVYACVYLKQNTFRKIISRTREEHSDSIRVYAEELIGRKDTKANQRAIFLEELLCVDGKKVLVAPLHQLPHIAKGPVGVVGGAWDAFASVWCVMGKGVCVCVS